MAVRRTVFFLIKAVYFQKLLIEILQKMSSQETFDVSYYYRNLHLLSVIEKGFA